jgi:D-alanyl-D-alanine carboxypeptidase/D-alanyl-D-alanine-endopeptidase (penicillin-binding protein 4)
LPVEEQPPFFPVNPMNLIKLKYAAALIAFLLLVVLASRNDLLKPNLASPLQSAEVKEKAVAGPKTEIKSVTPADSELAERIERLIQASEFASARWGISVMAVANGETIYQRNADQLFTPASNMKIYTTGIALDLLGADYRWRTSVYAAAQSDSNGRIQGDLILYGRGAPDLVAQHRDENRASLAKLAYDLYQRGIRRIEGNVIGDESYFRGNLLGDGWQWTDLQWYFGAEASALSVNENQIALNVVPSDKTDTPWDIKTSDSQGHVSVENHVVAGDRSARPTVGLHRGLSDNNVKVWGELAPGSKGFGARLSVHNPALWAAKIFSDALKARGITVSGQSLARDSRMPKSQRFEPQRSTELAFVSSQPLSEIARTTNKESNNLYAELILRTLGRERRAMLDLPEPAGRELGDDEAGLALISLWLARKGVPTARMALHDGSGLSRLNLVTPGANAGLLVALSKTASSQYFVQSLPIAGRDGTLGGRLRALTDRVSAKTGLLTYSNSLSGYFKNPDGKVFAFSVLCNDYTGRGNSIRLIDEITALLAEYPRMPTRELKNPR